MLANLRQSYAQVNIGKEVVRWWAMAAGAGGEGFWSVEPAYRRGLGRAG